jgi:myo-inositol-1(or 4)-monophosphatase
MSNEFSYFARTLADASAGIIKQYFRTGVGIDNKSDGSPVTIADRKSEEIMREMIQREFPDHGIIGEEFGEYQIDAEYVWVLDPIDGTKSFITGTPLFGTLIGLLHHREPILGVINHSVLNQFLIGTNGETRLNGEKVRVRPCQSIEQATVLASEHYHIEKYGSLSAYESLVRRAKLYRTWGDCYGYTLVATGYADVMLDPIMNLWDLAALIPVIEGAGGKITDWRGGNPMTGLSTIATAGTIHDEVVRTLNS